MESQNFITVAVLAMGAVISVAVFVFVAVVSSSQERRKERESLYRHETLRKLAEAGAATQALELLREEAHIAERRRQEGPRIGGIVLLVSGIGITAFLLWAAPAPTAFVGVVPAMVGAGLLIYAGVMAPRTPAGRPGNDA